MEALRVDYTSAQWEQKLGTLLRVAVTLYGNQPPPDATTGKQLPPPDAGYWRDLDKSNAKENRKRIPGKLDWEYWRVYRTWADLGKHLVMLLPVWKREILFSAMDSPTGRAYGVSFSLDIECKTGGGRMSPQQERTFRMSEMNPGRHPVLARPEMLPQLERILGVHGRV